jgi:hypothetical protein
MTQPLRFGDEISEIAEDLENQSHLCETFYDDPEVTGLFEQLIQTALRASMSSDTDTVNGFYNGILTLLTYCFHLGREHALRGYTAPIPVATWNSPRSRTRSTNSGDPEPGRPMVDVTRQGAADLPLRAPRKRRESRPQRDPRSPHLASSHLRPTHATPRRPASR